MGCIYVHVIRWSVNDTDGRDGQQRVRTVLTEEPMAALAAGEGGRPVVDMPEALPSGTKVQTACMLGPLLPRGSSSIL